jgi:hypothetical protein
MENRVLTTTTTTTTTAAAAAAATTAAATTDLCLVFESHIYRLRVTRKGLGQLTD